MIDVDADHVMPESGQFGSHAPRAAARIEDARPTRHHRVDQTGLANPEAGEPAVFVVRRIEIDYLKPGRMDDVLEIVTRCAEIGTASLVLDQEVKRGETVLVRAKIMVVLVSSSGKPQRLGPLVRSALQRFVNQRRET